MAKNVFQSGPVRFEWFVDRALVTDRVDKKVLKVLAETGKEGRKVIRNSILPAKKSKKARTVTVDGRQYLVPFRGRIIDLATSKPATIEQARLARNAMRSRLTSEGEGKPPRSGKTGLLKKFILYGVNPETEAVVIGAMPFRSQPRFSGGIVSVPQLLEQGGGEYINNELVKYQPRPYVRPAHDKALKKMREAIKTIAL